MLHGTCNGLRMYVYILQSLSNPNRFYVGSTKNLNARLEKHNAGEVAATKQNLPWRIKNAIYFSDPSKVVTFERYLKSGSGRAFSKTHF